MKDTGIGISEDDIQYLFKNFSQIDHKKTREHKGTGLGLAISQKLCKLMNGNITVTSKENIGSTFTFTVALKIGDRLCETPSYDKNMLSGLNALVIDDNKTNRIILYNLLEFWKINVFMSSSAIGGLNILEETNKKNTKIDFILVDSRMPNMDGFKFIEILRSMHFFDHIIIIMLTSLDLKGNIEHCNNLGVKTYLIKPIKKEELYKAICNEIKNRVNNTPNRTNTLNIQNEPNISIDKSNKKIINKINILIVEDDVINQKVCTQLLKFKKWNISVAKDGLEAIEILRGHDFDLILMDLAMPNMDGFETTSKIREMEEKTGKYTPIIAVTAYAIAGDKEKCLCSGMDGYISKPIDKEQLYTTIEEILKKPIVHNVK